MDYEILVSESWSYNQASNDLVAQVKNWIEEGWEPQGGVTLYVHMGTECSGAVQAYYTFSQAVVFKESL